MTSVPMNKQEETTAKVGSRQHNITTITASMTSLKTTAYQLIWNVNPATSSIYWQSTGINAQGPEARQ